MEVKYQHPQEESLTWSGRGKQPTWVAHWIAEGGTLDALEVVPGSAQEIDLGIGEHAAPGLGTRLYAQRIATGLAEMPEVADGELQRAVDAETVNINARLAKMGAGTVQPAEQPEAGQQQLAVCLREFGFPALTAQEFIQSGIDYINQATVYACRAGVAFWAAQEALKSENESSAPERTREFKDWITDAGLVKERVYECIRIAKFYSRLPEESRAKVLTVGKKQALLLASLPQDVIDQAAESGNDLIGKADMMTVAELKEEIKTLQRREKNYEAELERAGNQVKRLSEARKRTTDFLLRTEELREECMALQFGTELNLNSLKKLFVETEVVSQEGAFQVETIWIAANTIAARALDLVDFIRNDFPTALPDRPLARHLLNADEAARWMLDYPLIENRFEAERAIRESRREAARPRGPGRPKGSPNKADEG